jgi:hypothetical protein
MSLAEEALEPSSDSPVVLPRLLGTTDHIRDETRLLTRRSIRDAAWRRCSGHANTNRLMSGKYFDLT